MGSSLSFPNLLTVVKWSFPGSFVVESLSSDNQQLFAFGAFLGFFSDLKGYEYAKFEYPNWALPLGAIITGYLSVNPIYGYKKTSIVLGSLAIPGIITLWELKELSSSETSQSEEKGADNS